MALSRFLGHLKGRIMLWFFGCCACAVGGLTMAAFFLILAFFFYVTVAAALGTMWLCGLSPVEYPVTAVVFIAIFGVGWFYIRTINEQVRYRHDVYDWMHWTERKGWYARVFVWTLCIIALWSAVWHTQNFARLI